MSRAARRVLLLVALTVHAPTFTTSSAWAQPGSWPLHEGTAQFSADYTFGSFRGTTTAMRGVVSGATVALARGSIEVSLDSLMTGNGLRDKHMREALETDAYPVARFTADSIRAITTSAPDSAQIFGSFTVRGVTRAVIARARVRSVAGPGTERAAWLVDAAFPVTLSEYGIAKGLSRFLGRVRVGPIVMVLISARFAPPPAPRLSARIRG